MTVAATTRLLEKMTSELTARTTPHIQKVLDTNKKAYGPLLQALTDNDRRNEPFIDKRDAFIAAVIKRLKKPAKEKVSSKVSLNTLAENTPFAIKPFKKIKNKLYTDTCKRITACFGALINPTAIFQTLNRENLATFRINHKPLTAQIEALEELKGICDDAQFLTLAKITLLFEALKDSFKTAKSEAKSKKAAELLALVPIDVNPLKNLVEGLMGFIPPLFEDPMKAPAITNCRPEMQPKVCFHFHVETKKGVCTLEVRQNYVVLEEGAPVTTFSQSSTLSRIGNNRTFGATVVLLSPTKT